MEGKVDAVYFRFPFMLCFFFPFSFFELELIFAVSFGIEAVVVVEVMIVCGIRVKIVKSIIVCCIIVFWAMAPMRRVSAKYVAMVGRHRFRCYGSLLLVGRIRNFLLSLLSAATLLAAHPLARLN